MRIIGGKYGGQHLVSFQASHIRPTTDRVKESLFNILRDEVEGISVVDLFCGTGNLGLEALSRGAGTVTFVDDNPKSIHIVKQNLEKLKVTEPHQVIKKDVFRFLKSFQEASFDLILIDPPFTEEIAHDVMGALAESKLFHSNSKATIESGRREKIEDVYGVWRRYDVREFGDKTLSLYKVEQ